MATDKTIDKEQIYIITNTRYFPAKALELATQIANAHSKKVSFLTLERKDDADSLLQQWCEQHKTLIQEGLFYHQMDENDDFSDFMEDNEAAAVIFELSEDAPFSHPKKALKLCRELRIPYYFVKPKQTIDFRRVLVPVGFLVEEREKGIFCSGMGRFFNSELLLMPAKDYGSRARENTEAIQALLDKFNLSYQFVTATKDSFKVELEAVKKTEELNAGLLLISASRDYGMDDILFGPKEQKVIQKSVVPVMIINPRKDLYALCS